MSTDICKLSCSLADVVKETLQRAAFVFPEAPFTTAEVVVTLRLHIVSISLLFFGSFAKYAAKLNV